MCYTLILMPRMSLSSALGLLLLALFAAPARAAPSVTLVITGVYADPFMSGDNSEAVQLQNIGAAPLTLDGWQLSDGEGVVTFPNGAMLNAGQKIWAAKTASAFFGEFGFLPAYEYGADSNASVPNMSGSAMSLTDAGDQVVVYDNTATVIDALVYGDASLGAPDWDGAAVQPYVFGSASKEGQILFRKRQESNGLPVPDTDTRADWAQDTADNFLGKQVEYPGWDRDEFFQTAKASAPATIKYCVAPDNLYQCLRDEIIGATATISMEIYSLNNARLVDAITETLDAGAQFTVMLDGGALDAQGKWACAQIETHGGQCWIFAGKPQANVHKRYDNQHGKWLVIDGTRALIGSENFGDDAMPSDDKGDGTLGTRGGYLITDNPAIVNAAQEILERDFDPTRHLDVRRWGAYADDFPPYDFTPNYENGGKGYNAQFVAPLTLNGAYPIELVQCPDNCLRSMDALLGMVAQADAGDTLLVEQLYEYTYWGAGSSNPSADPNLRLEAYLDAARRGARVRILLDSFYDIFSGPRSNWATCAYVNALSAQYDIQCRLGNPTGQGIHMKMVLLQKGAMGFVHLGSINGSETSNKLNRELATQVESLDAYNYWANVFNADWRTTTFAPHRIVLPFLLRRDKP